MNSRTDVSLLGRIRLPSLCDQIRKAPVTLRGAQQLAGAIDSYCAGLDGLRGLNEVEDAAVALRKALDACWAPTDEQRSEAAREIMGRLEA
jgi:hypothetical protein